MFVRRCLTVLILVTMGPGTVEAASEGDLYNPAPGGLPASYQQLKHHLLSKKIASREAIPFRRYSSSNDLTMLYVAGGILAVAGGLAYINTNGNNEEFFSPRNSGLLIGGSISAGVLLTKFIIDKYR